ncbi:helix-loop-helix domain-containing protein [Endozoicomonas lisbonensis]|uniref:BHLH domain-containing protein n=1 Tax=Endozoicomonas lisbonensis TaxID=3120522 RepID=A0ABV2SP23_9GAMM
MNKLLFLVFFSYQLSELAFAQSFELTAIQNLRNPQHVLISPKGDSAGINNFDRLLPAITKTEASSAPVWPDDAGPRAQFINFSAQVEYFAWYQAFNVDDLYVGYKFLIEISDRLSSAIPSWLVAGLSAASFLFTGVKSHNCLMARDVINSPGKPKREGGSEAEHSCQMMYYTSQFSENSPEQQAFLLIKTDQDSNDGRPPEDGNYRHTRGNICHHHDCKGNRCIEAYENIYGQYFPPRDDLLSQHSVYVNEGNFGLLRRDSNSDSQEDPTYFSFFGDKTDYLRLDEQGRPLHGADHPYLVSTTVSDDEEAFHSLQSVDSYQSTDSGDSGFYSGGEMQPLPAASNSGSPVMSDTEYSGEAVPQRVNHNVLERNRRAILKESFEKLANAAEVGNTKKERTKNNILIRAKERIDELKEEEKQMQKLKEERDEKIKYIEWLKKQNPQ